MKRYTFHITETRELTLEVEAEGIAEAEAIAREFYETGMDDEDGLAEAADMELTVKVYGTANEEYGICQ